MDLLREAGPKRLAHKFVTVSVHAMQCTHASFSININFEKADDRTSRSEKMKRERIEGLKNPKNASINENKTQWRDKYEISNATSPANAQEFFKFHPIITIPLCQFWSLIGHRFGAMSSFRGYKKEPLCIIRIQTKETPKKATAPQ